MEPERPEMETERPEMEPERPKMELEPIENSQPREFTKGVAIITNSYYPGGGLAGTRSRAPAAGGR